MSNRGEIREQPSIPEPASLCPEHAWLGIALAAFVAAFVALYVDYTTTVDVQMGVYPLLSGVGAGGLVTWRIGVAERRCLREVAELKLQLRGALRPRQVREPVGAGRAGRVAGATGVDYWAVYTDVLEDLGGIEGRPSEG